MKRSDFRFFHRLRVRWAEVDMGAAPRFFSAADLSAAAGKAGAGLYALASWSRELAAIARTVEHPYNPGLMLESLVSRARLALNAK